MKHLILFFVILCTTVVLSQTTGIVQYGQEQGLNASSTYMLDQDNNGFIWVGSDNGLFRFDGTEFHQYNQKDGLKNIEILEPIALNNNEVFIVPYISKFAYEKNGRIYHSGNNRELQKIIGYPGERIVCLADKSRSEIALFNDKAPKTLYIYRNGKVKQIPLFIDSSLFHSLYSSVSYDFKGNFLFIFSSYLYNYNIYTRKITKLKILNENNDSSFKLPHSQKYLMRPMSSCFHLDEGMIGQWIDNTIYVMMKIDNHTYKVFRKFTFPCSIYRASMKSDGALWVALSDGGICSQDLNDKSHSSPTIYLKDYIINDQLVDHDGNFWFSTRNNGLIFMQKQVFENYNRLVSMGKETNINTIVANTKSVIFGYNLAKVGIYKNKVVKDYILEPGVKHENRALFVNNDIAIFGLTYNSFRMRLSDGKIKKIIGANVIKNIYPLNLKEILICCTDSVRKYNSETEKLKGISNMKCYTALKYSNDSLFLGTFSDLYKFSLTSMEKKLFLKDCFFTDLKPLGNGHFIGATNGNGIYIFNNKKILQNITEKDGLASNQIKQLTPQNQHVFWASTSLGLSRIDLSNKRPKISNYSRNDGLPSDRVSGCTIRNDTLFAGTDKGLAILSLKELLHQEKYLKKRVFIDNVTLSGKEYIEPQSGISGIYSDNPVSISLSFPDYISQGKVGYRYQVEGLSSQWQTTKSSKILLNAMAPGKYILRVYGLSYNGKRSEQMTVFEFEIVPRFWQTWWFTSLAVLLLLSVSFFLIQQYQKKRRDKKLLKLDYDKKMAELELQAIKAQINPHFIYNCLNSIQYLLHKNGYSDESRKYLSVFANLIRKTLHYSEKTFMPIREEIEYLDLYLDMEKIRFKSHFDYKIEVAPDVNIEWEIPSLLIQPFVENAIKHGVANLKDNRGNVRIIFEYVNKVLLITISDNGLGIKNKQQLSKKLDSFGIKLSQKRVETFRQLFDTDISLEIHDLSEDGGQGTEIKIFLRNEQKN